MRPAEQRRLRRLVRELLHELGVRPPLDVADLCARLGAHRGRPIVLQPSATMPMTAAYAMWIETDDTDLLFFQERTSPLHRRHLVLHEIGHIVAGHSADSGDDEADTNRPPGPGEDTGPGDDLGALAALMPGLPSGLLSSALRRHAYDSLQEQQAEYIASTILRWSADLEVLPVQPVDAPAGADRALNDRRGWL